MSIINGVGAHSYDVSNQIILTIYIVISRYIHIICSNILRYNIQTCTIQIILADNNFSAWVALYFCLVYRNNFLCRTVKCHKYIH